MTQRFRGNWSKASVLRLASIALRLIQVGPAALDFLYDSTTAAQLSSKPLRVRGTSE